MVAGHLQEKNGIYYMVLSFPDMDGKRKNQMDLNEAPGKRKQEKSRTNAFGGTPILRTD